MVWDLHSLADVGDGVHPAADANFVANVWRVAELVDDGDVVGVRALEELLLQRNAVDLQHNRNQITGGLKPLRRRRNNANSLDSRSFCDLSPSSDRE